MGNCCPSKRREGRGDGDPWSGSGKGSGSPDAQPNFERPSCSNYWDETPALLHKIWPVAASFSIECYEFSLYSLAINEIKSAFFADSSIYAWLCYAVPFLTRPFAGLPIGWIGDRYGRRVVVIASTYGMVFSTVAQGLVPADSGNAGRLALVFLRVLQGCCFSATPSLSVYSAEMASQATLTQGGLILSCCGVIGTVVLSAVFALLQAVLDEDQMFAWGWRLPYLFVLLPGLWSAWGTHRLEDSPEFVHVSSADAFETEAATEEERGFLPSLKALVSTAKLNVALAIGTLIVVPSVQHVSRNFMLEWLPMHAGTSLLGATDLVLLNNLTFLAAAPLVSFLCDVYGPSTVQLVGYGTVAVASVPLYACVLYFKGHPGPVIVLQLFSGLATSLSVSVFTSVVSMFPAELRSTGSGLVINSVTCVFGGFSPALLAWLTRYDAMAPAYFTCVTCFVSLLAITCGLICHLNGIRVSHLRDEPF
eukprot:GGOE01002112.1.p1 GENE.GGOE01002112.1~~GGOE01002112.1.p1  ORF type:complete len:478 (-),score=126.09 GGOE01002112.1:14-1447(-)